MTTCPPDYLHEDLIDCERRGITGDVCESDRCEWLMMAGRTFQVDREALTRAAAAHPADRFGVLLVAVLGDVPPPHPADFPRCEVRL